MTTIKQYNNSTSQWQTIVVGKQGPGVAAGGSTGQRLGKASATDYDTAWSDTWQDDQTILAGQVFG